MKNASAILVLAWAVPLIAAGQQDAKPLVLAADGRSEYAIVLDADAGPAETLAAGELRSYLGRIGKAAFDIARGARLSETPAQAIVVSRADRAIVSHLAPALSSLGSEAFTIARRGERLYLVGPDDRAVVYVVYAFLERLGCRWLAPALPLYADGHEHTPAAGQLEYVHEGDVIQSPALRFRKLYVEEGLSHDEAGLRAIVAWMPKLRWNTLVVPTDYQGRGRVRWDNWREALTPELQRRGITIEVGGHGYQNFLNAGMEGGRPFREHPEWFGMDEKGERTRAQARVFCSSNADAFALLEKNVLAYLVQRPEIQIFDFWPPDGAKWCTCDACRELGTPSERHALLVSSMADALKRRGSGVRLECIAYSSYLDPPSAPLDASVLVDFCPIAQCFEVQIDDPSSAVNQKYATALMAWRKSFRGDISIYSYYRKYAWKSLPVLIPHYMRRDLQYYAKIGVNGVSTYAEPGDWFTYEVNHYVLGRLAWAPDSDVDRLVEEFCEARYGPAAATAREVLQTLEETVRHACSLPGTSVKPVAAYDQQYLLALRRCGELLNDAIVKAETPSVWSLLTKLALTVEYASRDASLQRHRAADGSRDERRRMVDELMAFLKNHAAEGVFITGRLDAARTYARYGLEQPAGSKPSATRRAR